MTVDIEDRFASECRRQGLAPNSAAMQRAAVDMAGRANVTQDGTVWVSLPTGSISLPDFVRSLHGLMPEAFTTNDTSQDAAPARRYTGLTEKMLEENAANRRRGLPAASRERLTGISRQMADEIAQRNAR